MSASSALLLIAVFAATLVGRLQPPAARRAVPWLTLGVMLVLAIALLAQNLDPSLLPRFERDAGAIARGEIYRVFTALWFQDGGLAGGAFNLALLFLVGSVAERSWARPAWLLIYFAAGLVAEVLALWWQPVGAGNSVAYCGLAGSILAAAWTADRGRAVRIVQLIGLCAGAALALERDIHGAALLFGAVIGLMLDRLPITAIKKRRGF